ncbi:GNAT family N-acetyltransferase [Clostridium sp. C2-6-12]|uniref:GNAT family N-acetyltransferase n=1 Tax=Clostridium sp. C2-6-12 TaxID=2698832 RepID=UPI0013705100|nr:GNAT family N-acetyltransferase [Clostridium sp. C2-6-12]
MFLKEVEIGGYKTLYFKDLSLAFLKTIWINHNYAGQGIGTKVMKRIFKTLYDNGYLRLDLDTASNNIIGQKYYDKNRFTNKGFTRSYIRKN